MHWVVETLDSRVDQELEALPPDMRARFVRMCYLITEFGLENVRDPHVRHLTGPLWEIRMKGKAGISRALYVTAQDKKVVVLRAFVKKTQKTPPREIKLALERARSLRDEQN
ncbi:type II toxin-antitoxin system RelE/ParE family toxin [Fodinicurvata fenggangensis]|uniref:type II toxin-antitoxin system RelE/ParE family toxin n=1 Tax=Fodinicurvata fenggangensis TaxID=1121830 RepID=UPI000479ADCD|nr:type II toxin-antitoxin system RelE/ParE family toxin [Fodinicurvata fenggangensis]